MSEFVDIDIERVKRETDCTKVTALQLVKTLLADIESGKFAADAKVIALVIESPPGDNFRLYPYVCGMAKAEEVGWIAIWKAMRIGDWGL